MAKTDRRRQPRASVLESGDSEFRAAVAAIADERYSGDAPRGFAHVALKVSFPTLSFTDDQADEIISIDRRGDLGCDGLYIDDDDQQVLLFQAKSSPSLGEAELHKLVSGFIAVPTKFAAPEWLSKAHEDLRALANEYVEAVAKGFPVRYVFATASNVTATVRSTFTDLQAVPGSTTSATVEILGGDELEARYRKVILGEFGRTTDVKFTGNRNQLHRPESAEPVVYLTIPAYAYVAACKPYGMELFRYNPRLYLGSNKVNQQIVQTLSNDVEKLSFHLLNNGITAVCRAMRVVEQLDGRWALDVDDFQVVNGCQTSMTLFENSAKFAGDDRCLVDIKIIESIGLRDRISEATNTQTALVVEDAFANDAYQAKIADALRRHDPPYFYAAKRGAWEKGATAVERKKYLSGDDRPGMKYRKVTSKELGAVCLAAFGEPEAAKDKPRIVFEKSGGQVSPLYQRIFGPNLLPAQWILPFELLRYANVVVKEEMERAAKLREEAARGPGKAVSEAAEAAEGRARIGEYARFRMLHLAYRFLKEGAGEEGDFLSAIESQRLLAAIGRWAPGLLAMALDALVDSYGDARERDHTTGLREFFREKRHQLGILDRFRKTQDQTRRLAQRDGMSLDQYLGLVA